MKMHLAQPKISLHQRLHYATTTLPFPLQVDASEDAIGGVLLQNDQPVCFTPHRLNNTEKNYAQIEKECLAIVSCMDKWHQYLYGKHDITVHTDHQPLETILKKPLCKAPRRLQRMMLMLQRYQFSVRYKKGKEFYVADTLSRRPSTPSSWTKNHPYLRCCTVNTSTGPVRRNHTQIREAKAEAEEKLEGGDERLETVSLPESELTETD